MVSALRIGVLGAARITDEALIQPAATVDGVEVAAIAARDRARADDAARTHGIDRVHDDYESLLADPDIQAVYIPLPASLHGRWSVAALAAGKHVLVEKPFTANAEEAREVADAAARSPLVLMEAHHTTHHPQTARAAELVASGVLGDILSATGSFVVPIPQKDIRWDLALGGGALMDLGCYPLRWFRDVLGVVPDVVSATAMNHDGIDASMDAQLDYAGVPARVRAAMGSRTQVSIAVELVGTKGRMRVRGPYAPQKRGRIRVDGPHGLRVREDADPRTSYSYQLEAFRDAVQSGGPNITGGERAVETMTTIDAIYRAAGMEPRPVG